MGNEKSAGAGQQRADEFPVGWYREMVESAPDGLVLVDADGVLCLVNSQVEQLFGYPREQLVGEPVEILVPEELRERHKGHVRNYFSDPRARPMGAGLELRGRRKDGTTFPIEISLSPLEAESSMYATAAIRDVSDRRETEVKLAEYATNLERSNRELEQFAYIASHDLQAPLRNIASFAKLLKREVEGKVGDEADEYFGFIEEAAMRMQELINDILQLSRVTRVDREPQKLSLRGPIDQALTQLQSEIEGRNATIEIEDMPEVIGDELLLMQLFQNLIGNGIKFHAADVQPKVSISAERAGRFWRIAIRDNGIGIPEEHQERIFEIFQRLHTHDEYAGTGIGLSLCKKIVEEYHGGEMGLESEVGKGTTFWFTLPAA